MGAAGMLASEQAPSRAMASGARRRSARCRGRGRGIMVGGGEMIVQISVTDVYLGFARDTPATV
jgi:hypothetical protein